MRAEWGKLIAPHPCAKDRQTPTPIEARFRFLSQTGRDHPRPTVRALDLAGEAGAFIADDVATDPREHRNVARGRAKRSGAESFAGERRMSMGRENPCE